jgi:DNA-binding response OmpR family regulator
MRRRPRLLIAEDDGVLVELMREALQDDFAVETANDGADAVKKARRSRPDLILVDGRMPKMDGYQACRALRGRPETARVPIIVVTGQREPSTVRRAFACGATDYLPKPFTVGQLRARARTSLLRAAN